MVAMPLGLLVEIRGHRKEAANAALVLNGCARYAYDDGETDQARFYGFLADVLADALEVG